LLTEAPSGGTVLPLSDFGTVNLTQVAAGHTAIGNENPSALTMVSANDVTEATPSALTPPGTGVPPARHHHHHWSGG